MVDKVIDKNECWLYLGSHIHHGYGYVNFRKGGKLAHRLSYETFYGKIPDGKLILHHCDNPPCINPKHLYAGTQGDNIHDAYKRGRRRSDGEYCPTVKFGESETLLIRCLYKGGLRNSVELGRIFSVTRKTIRNIIRRKTWNRTNPIQWSSPSHV